MYIRHVYPTASRASPQCDRRGSSPMLPPPSPPPPRSRTLRRPSCTLAAHTCYLTRCLTLRSPRPTRRARHQHLPEDHGRLVSLSRQTHPRPLRPPTLRPRIRWRPRLLVLAAFDLRDSRGGRGGLSVLTRESALFDPAGRAHADPADSADSAGELRELEGCWLRSGSRCDSCSARRGGCSGAR